MLMSVARALRLSHDKQETFIKFFILSFAAVVAFSSLVLIF